MRPLLFLLVAITITPAIASEPKSCATPWTSYRNYHEAFAYTEGKEGRKTVFDEVTICLTESEQLSFELRVIGDKGDECRIKGQAKPKRENVFVYLGGGLRFRFKTYERKIKIVVESRLYESEKFPEFCSLVGVLELRHHSEQKPDN